MRLKEKIMYAVTLLAAFLLLLVTSTPHHHHFGGLPCFEWSDFFPQEAATHAQSCEAKTTGSHTPLPHFSIERKRVSCQTMPETFLFYAYKCVQTQARTETFMPMFSRFHNYAERLYHEWLSEAAGRRAPPFLAYYLVA